MDEKLHDIEFEMRTVDEFGNEEHMNKKYKANATYNGFDAAFLYEQVIRFMRMAGFGEDTIEQIQWVDNQWTENL